MSSVDAEAPAQAPARKSPLKALLAGLALAAMLGGGGFYAAWSGLLPVGKGHAAAVAHVVPGMPDIAFVPIGPILISLAPGSNASHLRFLAQLEVDKSDFEDVTFLVPRVVDVLNSYLRAVDAAELEKPGALIQFRSQMLRRVQMVTGQGRVRDLLIMEFVLN